jgi:hypothetical protein
MRDELAERAGAPTLERSLLIRVSTEFSKLSSGLAWYGTPGLQDWAVDPPLSMKGRKTLLSLRAEALCGAPIMKVVIIKNNVLVIQRKRMRLRGLFFINHPDCLIYFITPIIVCIVKKLNGTKGLLKIIKTQRRREEFLGAH